MTPSGQPTSTTAPANHGQAPGPWWRELNRYHWFVLIVAALGWMFDCLDQQLFNLARVPAMRALLKPGEECRALQRIRDRDLPDRLGDGRADVRRARRPDRPREDDDVDDPHLLRCTGLSALSVGFWDFAFYRFITGLGVGGEFAVGVALVAEVMPDKARPHALGLLQALSTVGNVTAALISMGLGRLEESGAVGVRMALDVRHRCAARAAGAGHACAPEGAGALAGARNAGRARSARTPNSLATRLADARWIAAVFVVGILGVAFFGGADWPKFEAQIGVALAGCALLAGLWTVFGGRATRVAANADGRIVAVALRDHRTLGDRFLQHRPAALRVPKAFWPRAWTRARSPVS